MSRQYDRRLRNALKVLATESKTPQFAYPRAFPKTDYYPLPKDLLQSTEPRWLYFLDCLWSRLDEKEPGIIIFNLDKCLARKALSERTLKAYLRRMVEQGWLESWTHWLLQLADRELAESAWDGLSAQEKQRLIRFLFQDEKRTRTYVLTPTRLQTIWVYKSRNYVRRGWSDYRQDVASRQVINGLFWGFTQRAEAGEGSMLVFEFSSWELEKWTRDVHGGRLPDGFRAAADAWIMTGVLTKRSEHRLGFDWNAMNRKAPQALTNGTPQRLRADLQRELGLDADADKEQLTLLVGLVTKKILREREVKTFLNILSRNHPHLLHDDAFKKLADWMIMQRDSGRPWPGWKKVLGDFVAQQQRKPQVISAWTFRFTVRTADGDSLSWNPSSRFWTALVIRYRLSPSKSKGAMTPMVRIGLMRGPKLAVLGDEIAPSRRFYRVADVSAFLKKLSERERVTVFAVSSDKDEGAQAEVELLGYQARPRR